MSVKQHEVGHMTGKQLTDLMSKLTVDDWNKGDKHEFNIDGKTVFKIVANPTPNQPANGIVKVNGEAPSWKSVERSMDKNYPERAEKYQTKPLHEGLKPGNKSGKLWSFSPLKRLAEFQERKIIFREKKYGKEHKRQINREVLVLPLTCIKESLRNDEKLTKKLVLVSQVGTRVVRMENLDPLVAVEENQAAENQEEEHLPVEEDQLIAVEVVEAVDRVVVVVMLFVAVEEEENLVVEEMVVVVVDQGVVLVVLVLLEEEGSLAAEEVVVNQEVEVEKSSRLLVLKSLFCNEYALSVSYIQ